MRKGERDIDRVPPAQVGGVRASHFYNYNFKMPISSGKTGINILGLRRPSCLRGQEDGVLVKRQGHGIDVIYLDKAGWHSPT